MLVDTHCHLSVDDYENLDEVISEMNGIMIASGCDDKSNKEVLGLVSKYKNVYGVLGIHPESVNDYNDDSLKFIEENINNPKIVGIGEIGLDYYWVNDNKDVQKELFIKQLNIAQKYNKPIVVHSRESIQDTFDILKERKLKGIIHCYSGSYEMAKEFIKLGYKLGIGGVLTFKNSKLFEVIEKIDLKDIVLETDSPYLSPEPFRGKQNNPYNIYYIAKRIAEIKNIELDEVLTQTTNNAKEIFDI